MHFEVTLPEGINSWALRVAGFEGEEISDLCAQGSDNKLPATVRCRFATPRRTVNASLTFFGFGQRERIDRWLDAQGKIVIKRGQKPKTGTHIRVEISDTQARHAARGRLAHYSLENDGEGKFWTEHCALYEAIDEVLAPHGLSTSKLQNHGAVLTRAAIVPLMRLCETTNRHQRHDIHQLFTTKTVAKTDCDMVAQWLIKRFASDFDSDDQLGMCIWEMAVPSIANDLVRLIRDGRYEHHRGPLCQALAKTKDPRAAEIIASVMHQPSMAFWCLSSLRKATGAKKLAPVIKKFLRHADSDVRNEAKKLLKQFGVPSDNPPPAAHLVKTRRIPKQLTEWSANIDDGELQPLLERISNLVDSGFATTEIAEVIGVVEAMKIDQTRTFRFPITANRQKTELWIVVFMDDLDAPDIEIHATPKIIRHISNSTREKESVRQAAGF